VLDDLRQKTPWGYGSGFRRDDGVRHTFRM
jgi:hypothetical protein